MSFWYPHEPPSIVERLASIPLAAVSLAFRGGVALRSAAYSSGLLAATHVGGAQVVSVGNLNVGGVGKTPVVMFIAQWAIACSHRVAVLSRGYGRRSSAPREFDAALLPGWTEVGDEPLLIAKRVPSARLFVGAKRVTAALAARAQGFDFLILDDGFQHRALARNTDLVVVDGARRFGNGSLLPRGPLREPIGALARADIVWVKGDADLNHPRIVRASHVPVDVVDPDGQTCPLEELRGKKVSLISGIGNPDGFAATVRAVGADIVLERRHRDHHAFTAHDIESARHTDALLLTTEKDAQRLPGRAWVLRLGVRVDAGLDLLATQLGLDPRLAPSARL